MLATWGCTTFPKPTLSLDFLGATSLDSGITFSRGSQATLFDSTGTLVYAKHNLLLQSQDFTTTWLNEGTTDTANTDIAPDGTTTADTITALNDSSSGNTRIEQQSIAVISGQNYVFSIFVKNGTVNYIQLFASSGQFGSNAFANFDLTGSGSVGTVGSAATATITAAANGFFRITLSAPATASGNAVFYVQMVASSTAARGASLTRTGQTVILWGAQLNLANMEGGVTSSLSTYYPTTTAAYYAPRFDYNPSTLQPLGLLIEEQRTNSIRNNTMQGAVAGTPGTLPTNWTSATSGLTRTIVGTGTSNGITYIDVRFAGTSTNTFAGVYFETSNGVAAANGQTWTPSAWVSVVGGSTANITSAWLQLDQYSNVPAYLSSRAGTNVVSLLNSTPTRYSVALTTNNASTAFVVPSFSFFFANGAAIDITLRIGLPQMELGAFATSVIPTTTTALTRNADVASMTGTNFSSWYNASEGTLYAEYLKYANVSSRIATISNNTSNNQIRLNGSVSTNIRPDWQIIDGGAVQANVLANNTVAPNVVAKTAGTYAANNFNQATNAVLGAVDTSGTVPSVSQINIGANEVGAQNLNGYVRRLAFYPQRLPDATLQALTA